MNEIPQEDKPVMKMPSYHLTLDYRGKVADILSYVEEIRARKLPGSTIDLTKINCWQSFVDGNLIPHLELATGSTLPFETQKQVSPHITLLDIENDAFTHSFTWFLVCLDRVGDVWREACEELPAG